MASKRRQDPAGKAGHEARPSALAGTWYPADPVDLQGQVDALVHEAKHTDPVATVLDSPAPVRALILPHAGLMWSGGVAACGAAVLEKRPVRRAIILGTAHYARFSGVSVDPAASYETPLGSAVVDQVAVGRLLESRGVSTHPYAHVPEHSIEIELPLLQRVLGDDFLLVPTLVSDLSEIELPGIADALIELLDPHTVLIVSSDMTHYGSGFGYVPFPVDEHSGERLRELDLGALEHVVALDRSGFESYRHRTGITICGYEPIRLLLEVLNRTPGRCEATVLGYDTSGAMTHDYSHSVSYASLAFVGRVAEQRVEGPGEEISESPPLGAEERRTLLALARRTIREAAPDPDRFDPDEVPVPGSGSLADVRAVFVTLRSDGALRGCIGTLVATRPLIQAVASAAWSAAFQDCRFHPVEPAEVDDLTIDISVLGPLRPIRSPEEIALGEDGVVIEKEGRRAVFLPKVATEQNWGLETFLCFLAAKAGLPPNPWVEGASYSVFRVEEFADGEGSDPPATAG